jgi:tRNA/tmRNA/rRNA uracil-C5-methylase (TrmA/RlmC/RlmD family)
VSPRNYRAFTGFLKGLTLRQSISTNETMCILTTDITSEAEDNIIQFMEWYRYKLKEMFPSVVSVVHAENDKNGVNIGEIKFIEGANYLTERILNINYQVSPFSFFQTNSYQLDKFIQLIIDAANIKQNDII